MKKFLGVFLVLLTVFSGCGKKKDGRSSKHSTLTTRRASAGLKGHIDEYVFDDSSNVDSFTFVEEDKRSGSKNAFSSEEDLTRELLKDEFSDETLAFSDYKDDLSDLDFDRINFQFNTDKLTKGQQEKLHRNIEAARRATKKDHNVEVRAYGCEMGSADYNLALSQKRANVIKNEMVNHGVVGKKVNSVGCGQEYQIAWSNATDRETRIRELSANRRAEISAIPAM